MSDTDTHKIASKGVPNRQTLYQLAASHSRDAITELARLMKEARQESVRIAAAKVLLDKALPDIKAVELTGHDGQPTISIRIVDDVEYRVSDKKLSNTADNLRLTSTIQDSTEGETVRTD